MVCPQCRVGCAAEDIFCRRCGADLSIPSKSLVSIQTQLPTLLTSPLPRVVAGVGAVAVGFGLELLRRGLMARLARAGRRSSKLLPSVTPQNVLEAFTGKDIGKERKPAKLPKGYEVQETLIYMTRVIRPKN